MSEKVDGSVYHEHRKKIAQQEKENKKSSEAVDQWVEVGANDKHQYGPKIVKVTKTKEGTFRQFIGRKNDPKVLNKVAALKEKYQFKTV